MKIPAGFSKKAARSFTNPRMCAPFNEIGSPGQPVQVLSGWFSPRRINQWKNALAPSVQLGRGPKAILIRSYFLRVMWESWTTWSPGEATVRCCGGASTHQAHSNRFPKSTRARRRCQGDRLRPSAAARMIASPTRTALAECSSGNGSGLPRITAFAKASISARY